MVALKIKLGNCFDILAIEDGDKCEVLDIVNDMFITARPSLVKLVKVLDRTADVGLMRNKEQFRALDAEISEFRLPGEVRILCFMDGQGIVVLTNGFIGQHADVGINRARELRSRYFDAKRNGYLTYRNEFL